MSNPLINRVTEDAQRGYAGFRESGVQGRQGAGPQGYAPQQSGQFGQAGYGQTVPGQMPGQTHGQPVPGFGEPGSAPGLGGDGGGGRTLTLDDVLMSTGALFAVMIAVGAVSWTVAAMFPAVGSLMWMGSMVVTLGLGLYIGFRRKPVGVVLAMVYAALEGVFVGTVSQFYHQMFDPAGASVFESIVTQAILATVCVFGSMLLLYKTGVIKVTERFRAIVSMAVMGYFIFALINFAYVMFFGGSAFGFGGTGMLGIGISLFAVGLASLMLTLDFDNIDKAITAGLPSSYSWTLGVGLLITLVWLYLEILRLLARLRSD